MLSLEEIKKYLGEAAKQYTDEELEQIRYTMHELTRIMYEVKIKPKLKELREKRLKADPEV